MSSSWWGARPFVRFLSRFLVPLTLACVLVSSSRVSAASSTSTDSPRPSVSPAQRAAAQALFDAGRALMDRGEAEQACPKFEASQRLESGLGTQYHLASCYEAIGRTASAHGLFIVVAEQARGLRQHLREEVARERAEALKPKLSRLRINVPRTTRRLVVERDGSQLGPERWGAAVPVDPGAHRVRASAPGLVPWEAEVIVPSRPGVVDVTVPALARDAAAPSFWAPTSRKVGAAALGLGAASLGVGTAFAVDALSKQEDSNRAGCGERSCPDPGSLSLRDEARSAGNRATWAFAIGASGLAAGAVLMFWSPGDEAPPVEAVSVAPVAHAKGGGLRLNGRF